jgi:hypothetical protein
VAEWCVSSRGSRATAAATAAAHLNLEVFRSAYAERAGQNREGPADDERHPFRVVLSEDH